MQTLFCWWKRALVLIGLISLALASGCGAEDKNNGGDDEDAAVSDSALADGAGTDAATFDSGPQQEFCNGIDDNDNGQVDEGCPCEEADQQSCYPAPHHAPEGCDTGTQICSGGAWGPCEGAELPPEDAYKCCRVIEDGNPTYEVLDRCVATYPPDEIPQCDDLFAWNPDDADCVFANVTASVDHEFVDEGTGGVLVANVEAGRTYTRQVALDDFGVSEADILYETLPPVEIEGEEGCSPGGRGFAWGAILYKTALGAVGEIVYLYVGICYMGCDSEAFLRSVEPIEVCSEGTVK